MVGTTYSAVAVYRNGNVEIIQNKQGKRTMPSCVAFTDKGSLVGDTAYFQAPTNPENTIYGRYRIFYEIKIKFLQSQLNFLCP